MRRDFLAVLAVLVLVLAVLPLARAETGRDGSDEPNATVMAKVTPEQLAQMQKTAMEKREMVRNALKSRLLTASARDTDRIKVLREALNQSDDQKAFRKVTETATRLSVADIKGTLKDALGANRDKARMALLNTFRTNVLKRVYRFLESHSDIETACAAPIAEIEASSAASVQATALVDDNPSASDLIESVSTGVTASTAKAQLSDYQAKWKAFLDCAIQHRLTKALDNAKTRLDRRVSVHENFRDNALANLKLRLDELAAKFPDSDRVAKLNELWDKINSANNRFIEAGQGLQTEFGSLPAPADEPRTVAQWIAKANRFVGRSIAAEVRLRVWIRGFIAGYNVSRVPANGEDGTVPPEVTDAVREITAMPDPVAEARTTATIDSGLGQILDESATIQADAGAGVNA